MYSLCGFALKNRRGHRDVGDGTAEKQQMELTMTGKERRQYVEWRAERDQIDAARLERAKSSTGQWRREWDVEKATQPADPSPASQLQTSRTGTKQDGMTSAM